MLMIKPYRFTPIHPINPAPSITECIVFISAICVVAFLLGLIFKDKFKEKGRSTPIVFIILTALLGGMLIYFFGTAVGTLKGIIFFLILLICSYLDIKTRRIDNYLSVMIVLAACIGIEITDLPLMCVSALAIGIPMLLGAIVTNGRTIGGADIKLSAASAFLLGIWRGYFGLIIGLILGIVVNLIFNRKKASKQGFPLMPYLSIGFIVAYFI